MIVGEQSARGPWTRDWGTQMGYAAMGEPWDGSVTLAHAVADDYPETLCGLGIGEMAGVAEEFGAVPESERCPECLAASRHEPERRAGGGPQHARRKATPALRGASVDGGVSPTVRKVADNQGLEPQGPG